MNDFLQKLAYNFSYLNDLKPPGYKSNFPVVNSFLTEYNVQKFSPKRFRFYQEFLKTLKENPSIVNKVIYEGKLIQSNRELEDDMIQKINTSLDNLYRVTDKNIIKNDKLYLDAKKNKKEVMSARLLKSLQSSMGISSNNSQEDTAIKAAIEKAELAIQAAESAVKAVKAATGTTTVAVQKATEAVQKATEAVQKAKEADSVDEAKKAVSEAKKAVSEAINETVTQNAQVIKQALEQVVKELEKVEQALKNKANATETQTIKNKSIKKDKIIKILKGIIPQDGGSPEEERKERDEKRIKWKQDVDDKKNKNNTDLMKYTEKISELRNKFKDDNIMSKYTKLMNTIMNDTKSDEFVKADKLKDIIKELEEDKTITINSLKLSKEDRLVFIGITFVIRLITLGLIDWALTTNFVINFTSAFILYIVIYSLFLVLFIIVVNITYTYPLYNLYKGDTGLFSSIASSFYYFYIIPGETFNSILRFMLHFGLILFITIIAILVKEKEIQNSGALNYNYAEKKKIHYAVHNFTLLMWIFTTMIAFYS